MGSLEHVRIVLVRPQEPRNVGAVCRVMKNFGLRDLAIVDPQGPAAADLASADSGATLAETARKLAVHAEDVLDAARVCRTVAEAVEDAALVAGTSRRQGQRRKGDADLPESFAERAVAAAPGRVAVLFGNERFGLNAAELVHASQLVAIPSDPQCPSLNLSHAVSVVAYLLYREAVKAGAGVEAETGLELRSAISRAELLDLVEGIEHEVNRMGFQTQPGPQGTKVFLSDVFGRAGLSLDEAARLRKLFSSLAGLVRSE